MLCRHCRRQVRRGAGACPTCAAQQHGGPSPLDVVLGDGMRVPLIGSVTIGRAAHNSIQLVDPSVSRDHARIDAGAAGAAVEDAGSSFGTFVDEEPVDGRTRLRDGSTLRVGDTELRVERRTAAEAADDALAVRPGATIVVAADGSGTVASGSYAFRPKLRPGYALKRQDDGAEPRYVLKDLVGGRFLELSHADAELAQLLDGRLRLPELVTEAERRLGGAGGMQLARLLADLAEHGLVAGAGADEASKPGRGRLRALLRPRVLVRRPAGPLFERVYRAGGFLLFSRPAQAAGAALIVAGLAAFAYLVVGRQATPLLVADRVGVGALVFAAGRLLIATLHELAHGLTVASFGRRGADGGVKFVLVFPYLFVDTSDAWFEPRARRMAISAAGPACDLALGGAFAAAALVVGAGSLRAVLFQLALAAYVGAFLNLNPLLDRDGYQLLVDRLRAPGLRRRSQQWLARRLRHGAASGAEARAVRMYALASLAWTVVGAACVILLTQDLPDRLPDGFPDGLVWAALGITYVLLFAPVVIALVPPLVARVRVRG